MDKQQFLLLKRAAEAVIDQVPPEKIKFDQHVTFAEKGRSLTMSEVLAGNPPVDMLAASFEGWMPFIGIPELRPSYDDYVPDNLSKSGEQVMSFGRYVERIFGLTSYWLAPNDVRAEWEYFFSPRIESMSQIIRRIVIFERERF